MKICFIADFFADEINGGGELNNEELINILTNNHDVSKVKSMSFLPEHIEEDTKYVICNFIGLKEESKATVPPALGKLITSTIINILTVAIQRYIIILLLLNKK